MRAGYECTQFKNICKSELNILKGFAPYRNCTNLQSISSIDYSCSHGPFRHRITEVTILRLMFTFVQLEMKPI